MIRAGFIGSHLFASDASFVLCQRGAAGGIGERLLKSLIRAHSRLQPF